MSTDEYTSIYSQDNPPGAAHGWVQWKGTNVCMDMHCKCGHHDHFDGDFFYYYKCRKCGACYAVGQNVKLIELNEAQIAYALTSAVGFQSGTEDEDNGSN